MSFDTGTATSESRATEAVEGYRDQTWEQCAGQREVATPLDHLPPAVAFHAGFPEPVQHDAVAKMLRYRGLMFHGSYSYLRNLSKDSNYLMAIDALYLLSATPAKGSLGRMVMVAAAAGLAIAALIVAWKLFV